MVAGCSRPFCGLRQWGHVGRRAVLGSTGLALVVFAALSTRPGSPGTGEARAAREVLTRLLDGEGGDVGAGGDGARADSAPRATRATRGSTTSASVEPASPATAAARSGTPTAAELARCLVGDSHPGLHHDGKAIHLDGDGHRHDSPTARTTPHCLCARGKRCDGPGCIKSISFGRFPITQDWSVFPAACGEADCGCTVDDGLCKQRRGFSLDWGAWEAGLVAAAGSGATRLGLVAAMDAKVRGFLEAARRGSGSPIPAPGGKGWLFQTWTSRDAVPTSVYLQARRYAPDRDHLLLDDAESAAYMETMGSDLAARYRSLAAHAHRADLLRYCLLLRSGGAYLDIDVVLLAPIAKSFTDDNIMTTAIGQVGGVFQGILNAPKPESQFFRKLTADFLDANVTKRLATDFMTFCRRFEEELLEDLGREKLTTGVGASKQGGSWNILKEETRTMENCISDPDFNICGKAWDSKHRWCSWVENAAGEVTMLARDPGYPRNYGKLVDDKHHRGNGRKSAELLPMGDVPSPDQLPAPAVDPANPCAAANVGLHPDGKAVLIVGTASSNMTVRQAEAGAPGTAAFCMCTRGKLCRGPGCARNVDFGRYPVQKGWSMFPKACGAKCGCDVQDRRCLQKHAYALDWAGWEASLSSGSAITTRGSMLASMDAAVARFLAASAKQSAGGWSRPDGGSANYLFQKWNRRIAVPTRVFLQARMFAPGLVHILLDDDDAEAYIGTMSTGIRQRYAALSNPAHKADLLRYCLLFYHGGYYVDIDVVLLSPLAGILPPGPASTTAIGWQGSTMQGILAIPRPKSPFMKMVIEDVLATPLTNSGEPTPGSGGYHRFVNQFEHFLKLVLGMETLVPGLTAAGEHQWNLVQERCSPREYCRDQGLAVCGAGRWDKYSFCCWLENSTNHVTALSRDPNYPTAYQGLRPVQ